MDAVSAALGRPFDKAPETGQIQKVAEGVFWVCIPLPMALNHVNCYVLDDGDFWTIVDTGLDTAKTRSIWQSVLTGPLAGKPVGRVIVTHHHPDHIGLAGWFQSDQGAELWTTRTAWLTARMLTLDVQPRPTAQTVHFWRSAGMDPLILEQRCNERPFNFADVVSPMPLGFRRLAEGNIIKLGHRDWTVRIGHGHAPEHATFWSQQDDLVLGGDQLLPGISPNIGVYATEPDADPVAEWLQSCNELHVHCNDRQLVLPGHKLPFTGLPVRMRQLVDNHTGALARLVKHLDRPRTAAECFAPLFKRKIDDGVYGLALVEAMAHLNHLYLRGQAVREKRADGAWAFLRKG